MALNGSKTMSNEIDLYKDLKYADGFIKSARENNDKLMLKEWIKERKKISKEIKEKYPDLSF